MDGGSRRRLAIGAVGRSAVGGVGISQQHPGGYGDPDRRGLGDPTSPRYPVLGPTCGSGSRFRSSAVGERERRPVDNLEDPAA
ncbi:hypothetical protein GE061_000472 [Apolygus lucorum]|uniref:Uncharacterized protein n=1 Tax=Apolygus lucorum TaxID=248454 RepID=A0A6A4KHM7_APOLU|nr:hypothetical protein GE061_000472 [Apolygus lucorum]